MIKVITNFSTLMRLAHALGQAKKNGDAAAIDHAQKAHDAYAELVRHADEMVTGLTHGQLGSCAK